jgi:antitoxin component of MazEF toxin-antitoxin module
MPNTAPVPDVRFVRLSRSGSSLVLTIPADLREQLAVRRGDVLEAWLERRDGGRLVLVFTRAQSARKG